MSDIKGLLSKTELYRLLGGWRRHLNPFHNPKAAIKAATKHDLILRKKAFWSIRHHRINNVNIGLIILPSLGSILSVILTGGLVNPLIFIIFIITSLMCTFVHLIVDFIQTDQISSADERPLFLSDGHSTGYPELDVILSSDPFEVESILADGGLQADEIMKLANFIEMVKQKKQSECQFLEGLVTVKTTVDISPQAWALVKRATEIISGKNIPRLLVSESPVIDMFSVMEHAGIDIHAPKINAPLLTP